MMQLTIDGQTREFIDIRQFRADYGLPPSFGVASFEPKDYAGLGSIEHAGAHLNSVRESVLEAVPARLSADTLIHIVEELSALFRQELETANAHIGLKDAEVDYAVAGFEDVCRALAFDLIRAQATKTPPSTFAAVYGRWLQDSVRLSQPPHMHRHEGEVWLVNVVNHAYGRVGLVVQMDAGTCYVRDGALACPAEGFMSTLLADTAARILRAVAGT